MFISEKVGKAECKVFWLVVVLLFISAALQIVYVDDLSSDMASLYARQVRQFAESDWNNSFFDIGPPLPIVLAGLMAKLGLEPFTALQLLSIIFYIGGAFLLRSLLREQKFSERLVNYGFLLYLLISRLMRYSGRGLMEPSKTFFLILSILLLLKYFHTRKITKMIALGATLVALTLSRGEGFLFIPFFGLWLVLFELWHQKKKSGRFSLSFSFVKQGMVTLFVMVILLTPQMLFQYKLTGWPVTDSRMVVQVSKVLHKFGVVDSAVTLKEKPRPKEAVAQKITNSYDIKGVKRNFSETFKGLYPLYLIPALVGIVLLWRRKKFTLIDVVLLSTILYNIFIVAVMGFITKRYIISTVPMEIGWTLVGLQELGKLKVLASRKWIVKTLLVFAIIFLYFNGLKYVRDSFFHPNVPREVGEWIEEHKNMMKLEKRAPLKWQPFTNVYHNGRFPIIMSVDPEVAYWAKGDWVTLNRGLNYSYSSLVDRVLESKAQLLVVSDYVLESCKDFPINNTGGQLKFVGSVAGCRIYAVSSK